MGPAHQAGGGDPLPETHVCYNDSEVTDLTRTWDHRVSARELFNSFVKFLRPPLPDDASVVFQSNFSSANTAALPSTNPWQDEAASLERNNSESHQYDLRHHLPLSLFAHVWRGKGSKQVNERVAGGQVPVSSENGEDRRGGGGAGAELDDGVPTKRRRGGGLRFPEAKLMEEQLRPGLERLKESLPAVKLRELMEQVPWGWSSAPELFPNKKKLSSVQDFFRYAELEGKRLFDELDADHDGQVRLEDLESAMRRRRLPPSYAKEFLRRTRRHWLATSFGWEEFRSLMEQKEASMLRAFNSLNLTTSGTLHKSQVLASLQRADLPATESNARAMMRFLDADLDTERGQVAYGQFRNFLLLLPPERLERDPSMVWFEAATVVPLAPPVGLPAGSVLKSALAGGLASGLSTVVMHPLDTLKTRVQASPITFGEVMGSLPSIGLAGLYRGAVPAITGQFASHGLRTGAFEATRLLLNNVAPNLSDLQVQPLASLCSSVLGTALRIPCEVLKQRLQTGMYPNVHAAIQGTLRLEGPLGLFRGTTATLCREVPFYVAGLLIYQEAKKGARRGLGRELFPWETLLLGGFSGGLAAVCTTPFDVIKTRMMTSSAGAASGLVNTGVAIVAGEGVMALYKGALPRFFWIAPLGAMNFAGYELAKQAMDKEEGGEGSRLKPAAMSG